MIRLALAAWLFYQAGQQAEPWLAALLVLLSVACYVSGLRSLERKIRRDENRRF